MIRLVDVSIVQGDFRLDKINLQMPAGAYAIMMGPTGCGKTTLIEVICGLRPLSAGRILFADRDVTHLSPAERNVGYVPQDSVLFPTMRISDQIEFSLTVRRIPRSQRRERIHELANLMDIGEILDRYPRHLSGGEKQRVALARALAFRPGLLCLDEPLSSLDHATRNQIAALLKRVHEHEAVSCIHITHDSETARSMGTIHFCFENGKLRQA